MMLLTKANRRALPPLYSQDGKGGDAVAVVKFFDPCGSWTWYATEFDRDGLFFGLVDGLEKEMGYFSLAEIRGFKGPLGIGIERDMYWTPKALKEIAPAMFETVTV